MTERKIRPSYRPIRNESEIMERFNEMLRDGILLEKDIKGEILYVTLAPNETKIIPHGLRVLPLYRIFLRKSGAGEVTDVDILWTDKTIGLKNEGANTVYLVLKLFPG